MVKKFNEAPRSYQRQKARTIQSNQRAAGKGKVVTRYSSDSHLMADHDSSAPVNENVRQGVQAKGERQHERNVERAAAEASKSGCALILVGGSGALALAAAGVKALLRSRGML